MAILNQINLQEKECVGNSEHLVEKSIMIDKDKHKTLKKKKQGCSC